MNRLYLIVFFTLLSYCCLSVGISAQTRQVCIGRTDKGQPVKKTVYEYDYVDNKPMFPQGDNAFDDYIRQNREYPQEAYNNGIQGRVRCSFVVDVDGSIICVNVLKSVCPSLDREAVRLIANMPRWTPGKVEGKGTVPVRVIKVVPFRR